MFKSMISVACGALLLVGSSVHAEVKPEDFHFKATLASGTESLRRVELPWSVMSNLLQKYQQDLRVYNAEQQSLPFAVRYVATSKQAEQQTIKLNFFPMGDIEQLGTILKKEANSERYKTIKLTQTGQRYLIIDNPKSDEKADQLPLQSLSLHWKKLDYWLPKSLKVEVSANLAQWQSVSIKELPYRLSEGQATLENNVLRVEKPITQRFIRLSGADDFEPLLASLKSVSAHYQQTNVTNNIKWNTVSLKATEESKLFQYDVLPSVPVERWRFDNLSAGSLYKGTFSARYENYAAEKSANWRYRRSFLQYSLETDAGLIKSPPVRANQLTKTDAWRFQFEQLLSDDVVPKLSLGWKPMELVFIAQGNGPFEIRYGSHTASAPSRLDLGGLLSQVQPQQVNIIETEQLSEVATKDDGSQFKYLLWGILAAAVLMLLFMARGLLKEMES